MTSRIVTGAVARNPERAASCRRCRWRWRDLGRWDEQERQQDLKEREKSLAAETRRRVFGEKEDLRGNVRNAPIVSMILKTRSVTQFDVLMDEVERVQEQYGIRIVIVHGGLGPVIIKDVTHAEVEKGYGFCPIYAFQVGVHPDAAAQADSQQIDVRRFSVFTDLIADVANRCERIDRKEALQNYSDALKDKPTLSGI
ncbi:unnamed protein product [Prorocentrum cordatum]|uniref:Translation initiation factor IF- 2 domain-containing protein n=1 Tax=Prorocentrum cordatum TaxID=2364126 RepID=A0ABN9PW77_9DINO|nr:unnamed protein product [Polarella glacialis]